MNEGALDFQFSGLYTTVVKFDDMRFYRKFFNKMPYSKGVDFFAAGSNGFLFLEVKDCAGKESENRWRIAPDNQKRDTSSTPVDTTDRDSLDIEMSNKVAMTLACLVGASTKRKLEQQNTISEGHTFLDAITKQNVPPIRIVLFLEGDFSTKTRSTKMIMKTLQDNIKKKLSWLECNVLVENLSTYRAGDFYTVQRILADNGKPGRAVRGRGRIRNG